MENWLRDQYIRVGFEILSTVTRNLWILLWASMGSFVLNTVLLVILIKRKGKCHLPTKEKLGGEEGMDEKKAAPAESERGQLESAASGTSWF